MRHYHAFGLRIASELELHELHGGRGPPDLTILYSETTEPSSPDEPWFVGGGAEIVLHLEGIRYTVAWGQTIVIQAPIGVIPQDVRIWLLGTVMAAALHQRGYLPIHANVVDLGGDRCAAFAGPSGAGKSTLAAWFESRAHRVLADDLCAIRNADGGRPQVFEGIPRVKLWSDALRALGRDTAGLEKVASDLDKFHVPMVRSGPLGSLEPLRLERIYLLDEGQAGQPFRITRLSGAEAARGVLANAFRWELGQLIQEPRAQFDKCLALARDARVFRIERRWGYDGFEQEARLIERHMMSPLDELGDEAV